MTASLASGSRVAFVVAIVLPWRAGWPQTGAHRHRFGLESEGVESPRARRVSDRPSAPPPPDYRTGDLEEVFDVRTCRWMDASRGGRCLL